MADAGSRITALDQLPYERPDMADVENQLRRARLHLRLAMNPESALAAFWEMQKVQRLYRMAAALARVRASRITDDRAADTEKEFYDQVDAHFDHQLRQFYAALLSTRHRPSIEQQLGHQLFRVADRFQTISRPEVEQDLGREEQLVAQYRRLMSDWASEASDETNTHGQLEQRLRDPDRSLRRQAHLGIDTTLNPLSDLFDEHFERLIQTRQLIAARLGFSGFAELAYRRLYRFGIGREEIAAVRKAVLRYIVPLTREIRHLQRRRLKLEHLAWYDLPCLLPEGDPQPQTDYASLTRLTGDILERLSDQSPSVFQRMMAGGYVAIQDRPGRSAGNGCSVLPDNDLPCLSLSPDGTGHDVTGLLHEAGHAYACARSAAEQEVLEYRTPAPETVILQSVALGYLALPHLEPAFGMANDNFSLLHVTEAVLAMPYDCLVDDFEHLIHDPEQGKLSAVQRHRLWQKLERIWLPDLDYEQAPFFTEGRAWQIEPQIWQTPFGRFNRVLAQLTALDLWRIAQSNPASAWRRYDKLCSLGGSDTHVGLLRQAEMASPFDPDTIKKVAYAVCDSLAL